jgi:TolA-binding protein
MRLASHIEVAPSPNRALAASSSFAELLLRSTRPICRMFAISCLLSVATAQAAGSTGNAGSPPPAHNAKAPDANAVRDKLRAQCAQGWELFYAGKLEQAAKLMAPLLKCDQQNIQVEGAHLLARCYWAAGTKQSRPQAQQMWAGLEKMSAARPSSVRLGISQALVMEADKKETEAIAVLEELLQRDVGNTCTAEAAIELSRLYVGAKRFDDARKTLDFVPTFLAKQTKLELSAVEAKPFLEAAKAARAHLKYDANAGLAGFEAAQKLEGDGKYTAAILEYQKIINSYPESDFSPRSSVYIGHCLVGLKQLPQARQYWREFISKAPAGPWRGQASIGLIDLSLERLLDLDDATKCVETANSSLDAAMKNEKSAPTWKGAAYDLALRTGMVEMIAGKNQAAADSFQKAMASAPKPPPAYLAPLCAAAKAGLAVLPADVAPVTDETKVAEDKVHVALATGVLYHLIGHDDQANALFELTGGNPASHEAFAPQAFAQFCEAEIARQRGKADAARDLLIKAVKSFPAGSWNDETLYRIAMLTQASKSPGDSVAYWSALVGRYPLGLHVQVALYQSGVAACEAGRWADAENTFNHFLENHAERPLAGDVDVRLIDIMLERDFSLDSADKVATTAIRWAGENVNGTHVEPTAEPVAPWRISNLQDPQVDAKSAAYNIYLRAALVAYLKEDFDRAAGLIRSDGPQDPKDGQINADKIQHIGLFFLQRAIASKKPVWKPEAIDAAKTDRQRTAIKLADLYLRGMRPDKSAEIYERFVNKDTAFNPAVPTLQVYACTQLARSYMYDPRTHGKALEVLQSLYKPEFSKEPLTPDGLVWLGTLTYNFTQDPKKSMPHFEYVIEHFPESPAAERAMYFFCLNAVAAKDKKAAENTCGTFLSKYPNSLWAKHVASLLNNDVVALPSNGRIGK